MQTVGMKTRACHADAFAGDVLMSSGAATVSGTPPALSARPASSASATRSIRSSARPAPFADDLMLGRALYAKTCQNCHTLYGVGGKIGPDITGSNRANLDYLLENIFDPSAVIPKDYAQNVILLKNERAITGIIKGDNGVAYTIQTPNEVLIVNKGDVILKVNGEELNRATGVEEVAGKICLQSEGAEIHFRNIRLAPLG